MVMGEGRNPNTSHLLKLADEAKIKKDSAAEIIEATKSSLSKWSTLVKQHGVNDTNIKLIQGKISQVADEVRYLGAIYAISVLEFRSFLRINALAPA